jgi:S1-C subfamily serine protease
MERIVLRHLKGSKAGQTEEFALNQHKELVFGREANAAVRFDPDRDDVVGRNHARLAQDPQDSQRFQLVDLNSRNGTFLNRQRVSGTVAIAPGDVIQLGAGGPEIQFDIEPRPANLVKSTRLAMSGTEMAGSAATKEASGAEAGAPKSTVGKATVERMVTGARKEGHRNLIGVGIAAIVLVGAAAAWQMRRADTAIGEVTAKGEAAIAEQKRVSDSLAKLAGSTATRVAGFTSAEVFERYNKAVVAIQFGWHLAFTRTGEQVYHRYIPNSYRDAQNVVRPIMLDGRAVVAAYVAVNDNKIEPALTLNASSGWPLGQEGSGTGFVVTNDGFILTNRHVGSGWRSPYDNWGQLQMQGVLVTNDGRILLDGNNQPAIVFAPHDWVPSETGGATLQGGFEGRLDYLNVFFRGNTTPFRTNDQPRVSDRHDVALLKIASASNLPKVDLDMTTEITPGTKVALMGYPGISAATYTGVTSKDMFKKGPEVREVPDPTLTSGQISKIVTGRAFTVDGKDPTFSPWGDVFQLDILATGGGNSGGPLINEQGKVVGIFFASRVRPEAGERVTFAVPIKFAKELLGIDETAALR